MKSAYRVFAYIIAAEVMVQAAAIAFGVAGLSKWVDDGAVVDKATFESDDTKFTGLIGFIVHGINGEMVIPLIAIIFLVLSFFAKVPGGAKWAGIVFLLVAIQVFLGIYLHEVPQLGALHGLNALLLFSAAVMAGRRVNGVSSDETGTYAADRVGV